LKSKINILHTYHKQENIEFVLQICEYSVPEVICSHVVGFSFQVVSKVNDFGNSWKVNPSCADVSGVTHHDHDMPEPPECAHIFGGRASMRYEDNSSFIVNSPFKSSMDYR
jgi:hypothetical protein